MNEQFSNFSMPKQLTFSILATIALSPFVAATAHAIPIKTASSCPTARPIVIAVIDTGLDARHLRFKGHLWTNLGEMGLDQFGHNKQTNQIDDDKNGFVDDVHGWNFADHDNNLMDRHGHGTHIAGIIAGQNATSDCRPIQLMILKYYNSGMAAADSVKASTAAIRYATRMGAQVINFSSGGIDRNRDERLAIAKAEEKKILFVAAAGNNASNNDKGGFYPASYHLSNVLSVAALSQDGLHLLYCSNFGLHSVDIAAPGQNITSTLPGGEIGTMTGTSQATAEVTHLVGRFLQLHPQVQSPKEIIRHLVQTATVMANFEGRIKAEGKLNSALALTLKGMDRDALGYPLQLPSGAARQAFVVDTASELPLREQRP